MWVDLCETRNAHRGYRSISAIVHEAVAFLDARLEDESYTIVLALGRSHTHTLLGVKEIIRKGLIHYMPSPYMLEVAHFLKQGYLSCDGESDSTFAAMMRMAYI